MTHQPATQRRNASPQHDLQRTRYTRSYATDCIGIVGFNDAGFTLCDPVEPYDAKLQACIQHLDRKIGGSWTDIGGGLEVAVTMLHRTPRGRHRRIWLLTDGRPNPPSSEATIMPAVARARKAYININCLGFGERSNYDPQLLHRISGATHNGKFVPVNSLRELTDALLHTDRTRRGQRFRQYRRPETTVLCLDLSGSMCLEQMEGKRKIDVVSEALTRLLVYKQQLFG